MSLKKRQEKTATFYKLEYFCLPKKKDIVVGDALRKFNDLFNDDKKN